MYLFVRTTRFATFPNYLMVQMKKFTLADDWTPKKLGMAGFVIFIHKMREGVSVLCM